MSKIIADIIQVIQVGVIDSIQFELFHQDFGGDFNDLDSVFLCHQQEMKQLRPYETNTD